MEWNPFCENNIHKICFSYNSLLNIKYREIFDRLPSHLSILCVCNLLRNTLLLDAFVYDNVFWLLQTHVLLMDAFLQNNRLDHVSRVMSSHSSYLDTFLRTQHFILRGDGPLPYDYRHLIAIMVNTCFLSCFLQKILVFDILKYREFFTFY